MKKQEQLRIVKISYIVGIILSFLLSYLKDNIVDSYGIISAIKVSSILTIWWLFYFYSGWKVPLLNKILYRINLNGTWYGTYESGSSDSGKVNKGDIVIRIKQNFLNINVTSYTEKYTNYSHSEDLKYDEDSDRYGLIYVYSQKENDPLDLTKRNGTAELEVILSNNGYKLGGDFWTILGTKGKLDLTRVSKDIINSFIDGKNLYEKYHNIR
ncbi:hypothetical protein EXM65_03040 [Clostridium botulinum]|uniref:CD-NTase-associated protein 15 domain-containing protein n=1 Tax=Clostridium botulinum TaxID=1491 RepID=A0A0L9Y4E3_CLOBO|nr:hypothetical protein [Clostridium botulinum]KAI3349984.1 hypothetical protein CIT18_05955 [Clostridium botulinum]KOM86586.1 hypothetical protein ACP51_17395 [Clostridium botulinum]KOR55320.1 hypothetical protein ADT22_17070 [Clostridium botulinum]NFA41582.1 hypothetical protein [Clostridium botulinum]NFR81384.1 hypothetical protein [Clostridium botulinum]